MLVPLAVYSTSVSPTERIDAMTYDLTQLAGALSRCTAAVLDWFEGASPARLTYVNHEVERSSRSWVKEDEEKPMANC